MVFTSSIFLFFFLPLVLAGNLVAPKGTRNVFLLLASLVFYAWGETFYVLVMLASILANYGFGLALERARGRRRGVVLALAVVYNLVQLGWFKYAGFVAGNLDALLGALGLPGLPPLSVHLPIGISFFTFQALSYVIDVYRGEVEVQRSPAKIALYITLFPQLIAGPIVRYKDVAEQIESRRLTFDGFAEGVRRFVQGMGKKMLLANSMGAVADSIMAVPAGDLHASLAWLGIACYALQIYYDFSGYSDMAIGLGRMLGFEFCENFDFPYVASSIREFWRRWHISLSTWFRDYLYIPLGGNRLGALRTSLNLWTVFLLCGLWHGASWNFVIWGGIHGLFLSLERTRFGRALDRLPRMLRHAYTLLVVLVAWVFFRLETLPEALHYLRVMSGLSGASAKTYALSAYLPPEKKVALAAGILLCAPVLRWLQTTPLPHPVRASLRGTEAPALALVLLLSLLNVATSTYNPFIYFRF
ncbi:membrane bound O-acyl transferase MBOAT family protein [Desulfovibrio sp. X2]|uniref:MBOAT family O-acyltransferase n=1 Tax=Desulfovibrio sp. X2 TaxID=941449 RepID=UPI0003588D25|nr:MBOAT family O-acyltransferase [Desulfovibrio sp. X2]EPR39794.1 membrane bound O-acyl transferase MBOAT family protein [Desulfovibrio sp. X2]